jgi:PAS domain S-box-containing protein
LPKLGVPIFMEKKKKPQRMAPKENTALQLERLTSRISELETANDALYATNHDLLGMIDNCHDALVILDGETRILLVNPAFERVMGVGKEESIGVTVRDGHARLGVDPGASMKVMETGKPQTVVIRPGGDREVLSTGIPVFDENGKIHRIYCNLRDITELRQLKEKFDHSQTLVTKYLTELHQATQLQTAEEQLVARSRQMAHLVESALRMARVDVNVLLLGESGVGKELFARMIHHRGPRAERGTFVKINCGAIPGELLESELFGYDPGAFTGASRDGKAGYFEIADRGTLMLDEIGDLPLRLQVKLLAVLQDHEVTRLGGRSPKKVDVRVIAATNRDLRHMIQRGEFREDLFYRLNVVPLSIPALRERREDIPFLVLHFLAIFNRKHEHDVRLSRTTVDVLCDYPWPGNIRELANLLERLVVTTDERIIEPEHLPPEYRSGKRPESGDHRIGPLRDEMVRYESDLIEKAVNHSSTLEEAAHSLGLSLSTLMRRLRVMRAGQGKPSRRTSRK